MVQLWSEKSGFQLARLDERITYNIPLPLTTPESTVTTFISGKLPAGMRLSNNSIVGTPYEVFRTVNYEFVIRAVSGTSISDRTFSIVVDGSDNPIWVTPEGLLPVNPNNLYFILDNTPVDFQLRAMDADLPAGDNINYFVADGDGELPPGLTLSLDGKITGIVDPILALDLEAGDGGYDSSPYEKYPIDFGIRKSVLGIDSFYYDFTVYDYGVEARTPRKLNRNYEFVVTATDNLSYTKRKFRIYVVGDDFLKADNNIMQADTGLYTADNTFVRRPLWLTPADLGVRRANNFVALYLDVLDPNTLTGVVYYTLDQVNDDGSPSVLPPGLELDTATGEIAGRVPYQPAVTKDYKFSITATRFNTELGTVAVTGEYFEDTLSGKTSIKIFKLPTTTNDSIDDLLSLVGRSITIEGNEYTVTSVNGSNADYDILNLNTALLPLANVNQLKVKKTATSIDYFFANSLNFNSREFYKGKSLNISDTASYKIEDVYPYIEWKVTPVVGSSSLQLVGGGDFESVLEALLGSIRTPAYVTTTVVSGNVTEVRLLIPANATNRNTNYIKSLFTSNTSADVLLTKVANSERVKLDVSIVGSFLANRVFRLAAPLGGSFEELFNVSETESYKTSKTFTLSVLGEVESTISWITPETLPEMVAGRLSTISVKATTTLVDSKLKYSLISGALPPGIVLKQDGELSGSVRQFDTDAGPGITYFDLNETTFDDLTTEFDRVFTFTVLARDRFGFSATTRTFSIHVTDDDKTVYSNIYMKPFLKDSQRIAYEKFINNSRIFTPDSIYRPGDPSFGLQRELKSLVYAGIEAKNINNFVAATARNHRRKNFYLGEIKTAFAKNPGSNEVIYEVIYLELIDPQMPKTGKTAESFSTKSPNKITVDSLRYYNNTPGQPFKYRPIPDNPITIDSTAVRIDQTTNSLLHISNLQNMRTRIKEVGVNSKDFLPLWMRTQQTVKDQLTRFVPAVPICYTMPGKSAVIVENIINSGFDFKILNYEIDRYVISNTDGNINEQYVLFANYKFNV